MRDRKPLDETPSPLLKGKHVARHRNKEVDNRGVWDKAWRHRVSRGPNSNAQSENRRPDRSPENSQARPPQPPGFTHLGRAATPVTELFNENRH